MILKQDEIRFWQESFLEYTRTRQRDYKPLPREAAEYADCAVKYLRERKEKQDPEPNKGRL